MAGLAANDTTITQVSTEVMRGATPSVNRIRTPSDPR